MPFLIRPRVLTRGVTAAVAAAVLLVVTALPAYADTSQAAARAASLTLLNTPVVDTGTRTSSNDGSTETTSGPTSPALSVLGGQSVLSAGVLTQQTIARNDGTSAACAGVVGAGGLVSIGNDGNCAVQQATPGGVVVNLAPATTLTADAILAQCTASSTGPPTAKVTIVNGVVTTGTPPTQATLLNLPVNAAPNTGLSVPGVVTLMLNEQPASEPAGTISTTALHLQLLGGVNNGADLRIGEVTCGPNATTSPTPAIVGRGLPVALGGVAAIGGVAVVVRRRRSGAVVTP